MCNQIFSAQVAQGIFEFHQLDENVMLRVKSGRGLRRLEVEGEPLLHAFHSGSLCQVEEEREVEDDGRGQDGIAAEEIYLDLHRIAEPAEDVYVVPALFVVSARRIIIDANDVREILVKLWIDFRLKNVFEHRELGLFFSLEGIWIVQDFAVSVA